MMDFLRKKKRIVKERTSVALKSGGIFLEKLIATCDGKCNPIRTFSADEILQATNNFDQSCYGDGLFEWYKGVIKDRLVLVKKWPRLYESCLEQISTDISVLSPMSSNKNVLKLLGCCLEFPLPVLVFEYAEKGPLDFQGLTSTGETIPWNIRLKIAKEVANAVTYLHTAFPRTIVHRDIKPTHIFLDQNWTAKLSDCSLSISIPEGESYVEDDRVVGTLGYVDPDYWNTSYVMEETDVFSFGTFLLVLLTGKPAIFDRLGDVGLHVRDYARELFVNSQFIEIVDPAVVSEMGEAAEQQQMQMLAFLKLALICTEDTPGKRPKMIEVAKELKRIERAANASLFNSH